MRQSPRGPLAMAPLLLLVAIVAAAVISVYSAEQRVVCYYTNWSVYRPGGAKFSPQNINPYLCTHLIYAFGGLTKENGLRPFDKYQDIEQGGYAKFNGLKTYNKQLKTLLAIGGWNEGSTRFSPLVADSERRVEFVKNVVRFLRQNNFDGLDLDWEYPAFRDGGKPRDRANYAALVAELRAEFERESSKTGRTRLLLTMAVPAGTNYIDKGYDVPSLNNDLDFMNILSYDYHSAFEPVVNHHAPLYSGGDPDNEYNFDAQLSIEHTINHYVSMGADRDKLVLGIPTYGRSYTLFNPVATEIGSAADGPGEQGDATREKGYLAYYEICESVKKDGWTVERPRPDDMGPIAYKGNQWVGYDDEEIVRVKARYVAAQGLGGIMFWSIDNDDFRGKCHDRPYPLIEAGKEALLAATKTSGSDSKRPKPSSSSSGSTSSSSSRRQRPGTTSSSTGTGSSSKRRRPGSSSSSSSRTQTTTTTTSTTTTPVPPNLSLLNTPEPPTTPDPGSDFVCKDEGFFPHPRDCKKYFWCLDSGPSQLGIVAHQFTCPSGLVFNKLADSCDYSRNVICNIKKAAAPASTTTSAPSTTTSTAATPSTRNPLFRPTFTTTTTTTTTTTPAPEEEEYEEEEYEEDLEEDPKAIKELLDLIKRLGGVEQLEKQLGGVGRGEETSVAPERPNISKSLYERVLSGRSRVTNSGGVQHVPSQDSSRQEKNERKPYTPTQSRSRGPQNQGLEDLDEVRGLRKDKPKYTEIRRPTRPRTEPEEEEEEEEVEEPETSVEEEVVSAAPAPRPVFRPATSPKYTSIRREKPSTTAAPEEPAEDILEEEIVEEEEVVQEQPKRKYVSLNRPRPAITPERPQDVTLHQQQDADEVPALVREIPAPSTRKPFPLNHQPHHTLEFEGRVEEVTQVGLRHGNSLRRQVSLTTPPDDAVAVTDVPAQHDYITLAPNDVVTNVENIVNITVNNNNTSTSTSIPEQPSDQVSSTTNTNQAGGAFYITRPTTDGRTQRVFVVNAVPQTTTTTTEKLPETTLTSTEVPSTTVNPPTTLEEITETHLPSSTTPSPPSTSTITRVVTSITESPIIGRTIITIHRKLNFTLLTSLLNKVEDTTLPMTVAEVSSTDAPATTLTPEPEVHTEPSTSTTLAKRKRPVVIRRRPTYAPKPLDKPITSTKPPHKRRWPLRTTTSAASHDDQVSTESSVPSSTSARRFYTRTRKISYSTTTTTETPFSSTVIRRRFRPTTEASVEEELTSDERPAVFKPLPKRRKVIRVRQRPTTTTTTTQVTTETPLYKVTHSDDPYVDSRVSASGNEVFLLSSSHSGPDQDVPVIEENEIDENGEHDESPATTSSTTTTTTEALPSSTFSRPQRPLAARRPAFPSRGTRPTSAPRTATTSVDSEPSEEAPSSARPRVVSRRKPYRPTVTKESPDYESTVAAIPPKARRVVVPRRRTSTSTTTTTEEPLLTTTAVGETSPLLLGPGTAVYYTRSQQGLHEIPVTEEIPDHGHDLDLANVAVAALTNLATAPPSAPSRLEGNYDEVAEIEYPENVELTPAPTTTTPRPRPLVSSTAAPVLRERAQRPSSQVEPQQFQPPQPALKPRPFTRIRNNNNRGTATASTAKPQRTTTAPLQDPALPDYDFYDDQSDLLIPSHHNKVKIHEDGSLECLDRGNFAHPFSCRKFISCALMENGALLGWIYTCPKHLAFDPIGGICNWSGGCKEQ